jgi:predicted HicB family RNase H-like nuclease
MDDIKKELIKKLKDKEIKLPKLYSGAVNIRVSAELHQLLSMEANEQLLSLNSFLNNILNSRYTK